MVSKRSARSTLEARRAVLVQRLDDGDRRIADARSRGGATEQWETFWLQLLDEYVAVSEDLSSHGGLSLGPAAWQPASEGFELA